MCKLENSIRMMMYEIFESILANKRVWTGWCAWEWRHIVCLTSQVKESFLLPSIHILKQHEAGSNIFYGILVHSITNQCGLSHKGSPRWVLFQPKTLLDGFFFPLHKKGIIAVYSMLAASLLTHKSRTRRLISHIHCMYPAGKTSSLK